MRDITQILVFLEEDILSYNQVFL